MNFVKTFLAGLLAVIVGTFLVFFLWIFILLGIAGSMEKSVAVHPESILKIDFSEQTALLSGEPLDLTPKEYRTLFLFVKNPRIILTKRQILEKLWDIDGDFVDEHTLTTIISRIRKKIETDERKYIKTAYGMGYQWIGGEPR